MVLTLTVNATRLGNSSWQIMRSKSSNGGWCSGSLGHTPCSKDASVSRSGIEASDGEREECNVIRWSEGEEGPSSLEKDFELVRAARPNLTTDVLVEVEACMVMVSKVVADLDVSVVICLSTCCPDSNRLSSKKGAAAATTTTTRCRNEEETANGCF